MDERDGETVWGGDRHRAAGPGQAAGEGDRPARGRPHRRIGPSPDVEAAVLSARVRIVTEREWSKHRPVHGPGPGERGRNADLERDEDRQQDDDSLHRCSLLVVIFENGTSVASASDVVNRGYSEPR
jgi:hypothetical protein